MNFDHLIDPKLWAPLFDPTDPTHALATWRFLGRGLLLTLQVTVIAATASLAIGTLLALLRLTRTPVIHYPALVLIEGVRALPVLFIIFFTWAALISFRDLALWVPATVGLTVYTSAVTAEIIRAGISSIELGQLEASRALGLSYPTAMRHVILPQALRRMVPPLISQLITLLKDTSLASIIGLAEFFQQGRTLYNFWGNPLQTLLTVALVYMLINTALSRVSGRLEEGRQRSEKARVQTRETVAPA
jgi:His/Glu/Gln/Arg/opine family amino acid ABC transporter permease subunit